jgi:ABC-type sulfate/molybdate transport systems ATPase subunit
VIALDALEVRAGGFRLGPLSWTIPAGAHAFVLGPTGAGKTTLLEAIAGHHRASAGRIRLGGRDATRLPPERRGVGLVYQHYHLFPHLTVRENLGYALPRGARAARVAALAQRLGLAPLLDRMPGRLSGGERQRAALARAIAHAPAVVLLDEPFAALDPASRRLLGDTLRELHAAGGTTILQVTHDVEEARRLGDVAAVLLDGVLAATDAPDALLRRPPTAAVARFLGTVEVISGEVGDVADGGAARWFRAGALRLAVAAARPGPASVAIDRGRVRLLPPAPHVDPCASRATVVAFEPRGLLADVWLDAGVELRVTVTAETAARLGLAPGERVQLDVAPDAVRVLED